MKRIRICRQRSYRGRSEPDWVCDDYVTSAVTRCA